MPWLKVNKSNPCPICEKPDWCGYTEDGAKVRCMRIQNACPHPKGGWIHTLCEAHGPIVRPEPKRYRLDVPDLANSYRLSVVKCFPGETSITYLNVLSGELGVSEESLARLWLGWDGQAWTFPMRDGQDEIIGIRRRFPSGKKRSLEGGRNGLFIPTGLKSKTLFVCEGPTDCAALLDLGYDCIGRPSCNTGGQMLLDYLKYRSGMEVVIMSDRDEAKYRPDGSAFWPGQEGARQLLGLLKCHVFRSTMIIPRAKDVRQWIREGATRSTIEIVKKNSRWQYNYSLQTVSKS